MKTERGMKNGHYPIMWRVALAAILPLWAAACGHDPAEETARLRGDRAFARGDYEEALAEYRLSLLREDPGTDGLVRAAHAYVALGRVDEARALYDEAAREDSVHADQAVSDFVALARREYENGDNYGAASAMEAALHFRSGILVEELALPLARHYSGAGEHGRAGAFYLRALRRNSDDPDVLVETALAHEEIGDCESALVYYDEFRELAPRRESEIRLNLGNCSFLLAGERRAQGANEEAIAYLDAVLELNEPRALVPQAHFEKAEILAEMGDCPAALESYRAVADAGAAGPRSLVRRARNRIDEIRFGSVEDGLC
ncbi:MAG: tetratricopeptide repeat protein [Gemmatimonadetes bacterium]|nr:tetratricopeptide repeat protein [Gemmatimonadota bacterium]MYA63709.1 tetratricopeptide repeat protein [Gemmatimonadota bacterium]MYB99346.1 tetratricopeptide repeat protein [Gemmatimonadota bacterium]MYH52353.1 tetratricopeptide repeat protein [Gemmatimonadota bacterium]MYI45699.1 tetratricopeptide repeat protein [Gemmatimonadota bacterium]